MLENPVGRHQVEIFSKASDFFDACSSFLSEQEAENNLIFGIGGILGTASSPYKNFYLATVGGREIEGAFLMTPPHKLIISSPASENAMSRVVADFVASGRPLPGVRGRAEYSDRFANLWQEQTGREIESSARLFCYRLGAVATLPLSKGNMRHASETDLERLVVWSQQFEIDADVERRNETLIRKAVRNGISEGHYFLWEDDEPVSLVRASGATPTGIRISTVYTPHERRGRGYASSLVAKVSALKLSEGRKFCFLFTDAANPSTNKIYQRIGYKHVCEFHEHTFS